MIYEGSDGETKYESIKTIGKGSFGDAELVKELNSGQHFILKKIELALLTPKERRSAINEVRLLSSLRHPYIIRYYESILLEGFLCIVMEYATLGDLSALIKQSKSQRKLLDPKFALQSFTQICLALKHMHEKHILHRDIKASNIFLMDDRVCVGDFGISRSLENTNCFAQTAIGTPFYLCPEICRGEPYNWSSDVWSLGCLLYEMLTNEVPFQSGDFSILMKKISDCDYVPLSESIHPDIRQLVTICLETDSTKRMKPADIIKLPVIQNCIKDMLDEKNSLKKHLPEQALDSGEKENIFSLSTKTDLETANRVL